MSDLVDERRETMHADEAEANVNLLGATSGNSRIAVLIYHRPLKDVPGECIPDSVENLIGIHGAKLARTSDGALPPAASVLVQNELAPLVPWIACQPTNIS